MGPRDQVWPSGARDETLRWRRVPAPVAGTGRQEVDAGCSLALCGHLPVWQATGGGGDRCSQVVRLLSLAGVTQWPAPKPARVPQYP